MNAEAARLGAYDTVVQTPSGLDGWDQLTSAYDMALILRAFVSEPRLVAYDRLPSASFPPRASKYGRVGAYQFDNQSRNFLTTVPGALVVKSGYTDAARHTYLAASQRRGRRLGVILLRDERQPVDQFQQARSLLDWGYALKPGTQPVGVLAGTVRPAKPGKPVMAAAAGRTGAVAALSQLRPPRPGAGWTPAQWLPFSALTGGGLWLAFAAAGRRGVRRRAPRPR
jgi:D-alanyl-D-alanine carboxypeptidase (penicillin-binding protein 5/6)